MSSLPAQYPAQHVLIVDDAPAGSQCIVNGFRQFGAHVNLLEEPCAVVSDILYRRDSQKPRYTVAVISLELSGMSGYRLQKKLTGIDPQLHTVACTSRSDVIYQVIQHGFDSLILKPVQHPQIDCGIQMILEGRPVQLFGQLNPALLRQKRS